MAKNHMEDIAKMLGVEMNEEFKITGYSGTFMLTDKGLMWINPQRHKSSDAYALENLLAGRQSIIIPPWQPKYDEKYYKPSENFSYAVAMFWHNRPWDFAYKQAGMVFKTKEECEEALPALRKKCLGDRQCS